MKQFFAHLFRGCDFQPTESTHTFIACTFCQAPFVPEHHNG